MLEQIGFSGLDWRNGDDLMRMIRLLIGRLCFKPSLRLALAGTTISRLKFAPAPCFAAYHY